MKSVVVQQQSFVCGFGKWSYDSKAETESKAAQNFDDEVDVDGLQSCAYQERGKQER